MATVATEQTDQEFVLSRYPTAFALDDGEGESVQIKVRETEKVACPCCNQMYTQDKHVDLMQTLGSGGSSKHAWQDARKKLISKHG